jgi:hypothetical protein
MGLVMEKSRRSTIPRRSPRTTDRDEFAFKGGRGVVAFEARGDLGWRRATRSVEVADPAAPPAPTGVESALDSGQAYIVWNAVPAAATWAITATPTDGGAPVRDVVPATQFADYLALTPGKWSLSVQAVDAADRASLPSAPRSLTVPLHDAFPVVGVTSPVNR